MDDAPRPAMDRPPVRHARQGGLLAAAAAVRGLPREATQRRWGLAAAAVRGIEVDATGR